MVYKDFADLKLSALGMGTMRLPVVNGKDECIDVEATKAMVKVAMDAGVNYYDTAWGYHAGQSEIVMGEVLADYDRSSFYLASKFPGYDVNNMDKVKEIFPKQLEKTGMEYFDFYLIHNVCEANIDHYLDEKYGIFPYLLEKKQEGKIKHFGCSMHGEIPVMKRFLEKYSEYMEFVQIQLNWYDWEFQKAKEKVDLIKSYGLPIWVMEPVRGGKLVSLSKKHEDKLKAYRPTENIPAWCFRFLQTIPEVTMILSGMSNMEQLKDNLKTFEEEKPLNGEEMTAILDIAEDMIHGKALPCTACHYCTSHCKKGLDIPELIKLYNEQVSTEGRMSFLAPMRLGAMDDTAHPKNCVGCGECAKVCPQNIDIPGMMKDFVNRLS